MTQQQMPPMFKRTGSSDFPDHLKVMVTGPPKSGKTFLLGSVPNILILDTEPHANNLQSVAHLNLPYKTITSTNELREAQFILSQEQFRATAAQQLGMPSIDAVAIDTLDTLQGIMKRERMTERRQSQFLRDDWAWLKEEMVSIIEAFTSLPMHVFFIVHTKTKEVGSEKAPRTVFLPGLEGSIAESIAGMVGYSLLSFRKEEINPANQQRFTKYWLRAEGDETYEYLGNRAAGRLPDIIEPNFKTIYEAAMANRPQRPTQQIQVDVQGGGSGQQLPSQQQAAPAAQPVVQDSPTTAGTAPAAVPPAAAAEASSSQPQVQTDVQSGATQTAAQPSAQNVGQSTQAPKSDAPDTNDDPRVNATALGFVKRVYVDLQQSFPEDKVRALRMSEARELVTAWKALRQDESEGKGGDVPAIDQMTMLLKGKGLLVEEGEEPPAEPEVEAKIDGSIAEVKKYVGDDLARAQEAYDLEVARPRPRGGLTSWLESKGVTPPPPPPSPAAQAAAQPALQEAIQTSVENAPTDPEQAATGVTPAAAQVDGAVTEEQGVLNAQQGLGATLIPDVEKGAKCDTCGGSIDDADLAELGQKRYGKTLCVKDYIAEGKK